MDTNLWRIKFRTSPNEYVYTHAVPVSRVHGVPGYVFHPSLCGLTLPGHMRADIDAFRMFINQPGQLVDCYACANRAGLTSTTTVTVQGSKAT